MIIKTITTKYSKHTDLHPRIGAQHAGINRASAVACARQRGLPLRARGKQRQSVAFPPQDVQRAAPAPPLCRSFDYRYYRHNDIIIITHLHSIIILDIIVIFFLVQSSLLSLSSSFSLSHHYIITSVLYITAIIILRYIRKKQKYPNPHLTSITDTTKLNIHTHIPNHS